MHLTPGWHSIDLTWPFLSGQSSVGGTITIEEGKIIYLELSGTSRLVGAGINTMTFQLGSGLERRDDTAIAAIAGCCKFKPPKP